MNLGHGQWEDTETGFQAFLERGKPGTHKSFQLPVNMNWNTTAPPPTAHRETCTKTMREVPTISSVMSLAGWINMNEPITVA